MLDFEFGLGEDIDMLRQTVRAFAEAQLAARAEEIDRSNQFPRDLWPPSQLRLFTCQHMIRSLPSDLPVRTWYPLSDR